MKKSRTEKDALGEIKVDASNLWGSQTQRSLENFEVGNELMPEEIIQAFAIQKKACAISNIASEKIDISIGEKILEACDEIIEGKFRDQFPLSVWQTGSGTQTNMNVNEVIAYRANQLMGKEKLEDRIIHPNDHCNMSQSSNDSFPSVIHIAITLLAEKKLTPSIQKFISSLKEKEKEFSEIIKIGRTHFQDATPLTQGQELSSFRTQFENALNRIKLSLDEILFIAQGGTAVGTGLNSSKKFIDGFLKALNKITSHDFKTSKNFFEALSSHDQILNLSSAINILTTTCYKMCSDFCLLSSGPRSGIGELILPANEPGSSIMPGKVNPTQCESMAQVCIYLFGIHNSISFACSQGNLQLNTNKTLLAFLIIKKINLIADSLNSFRKLCLQNIKINQRKITENLENSLMLVTALNPSIGYKKSSEIANKAFREDISLREAAIELNYLSKEEFDKIVNPKKMI